MIAWRVFGFWTVGWTKVAIWTWYFGLWEIAMSIFFFFYITVKIIDGLINNKNKSFDASLKFSEKSIDFYSSRFRLFFVLFYIF